jgi:ribosomal protein L37AE/L43A
MLATLLLHAVQGWSHAALSCHCMLFRDVPYLLRVRRYWRGMRGDYGGHGAGNKGQDAGGDREAVGAPRGRQGLRSGESTLRKLQTCSRQAVYSATCIRCIVTSVWFKVTSVWCCSQYSITGDTSLSTGSCAPDMSNCCCSLCNLKWASLHMGRDAWWKLHAAGQLED